jgi:solute:Na+ symporter, SSS family
MLTVKLVKNASDFINAGRRLPMFLNASALFALWFGSETIIGASSEFIQHGLLGVIEDPFGALISAILSTCSGSLLAPASVFSENIIRPLLGHRIEERTFLLILRLSVAFFAILALFMSLSRRNIYELVAESSILGMVTLLVPMIIALYGRRYYAPGAMYSMFAGLIVWFITSYIFDREMQAVPLGLGASILGMIFGVYRTRWKLRQRYQRIQRNI